ncbi:MAG TPA: hypothetical protein DCS66_09875 [Flavobacteriaceae bacterium]|nr:hypothetical protein [Flavobacteriaceae bacterium]HAT64896.1 hypothetical protein [Flavobacteriaceae bacterium]|tara:strand:- start:78616 stop:79122 length:507 start_codon:yes stop_codon:yes gene_type:complete
MALDNLLSISFTQQELDQITAAVDSLNQVLDGKVVNLSPEERQQYGSIADRNKILVDKCKAYMEQAPETLPRTVDKVEFDNDYIARQQLEIPLRNLNRVVEKLRDTKTLLDHDNFHNAISYYRYVKYLAGQNEPGTTSIYEDLKQHYKASGSNSGGVNDTDTDGGNTP